MPKLKVFSKEPASDLFEDLIYSGGTPVQECDHCGRIHYNSEGEFMEKGELEGLQQKSKEDPEKYVGHSGQIYWGFLAGKRTVAGCPCNFPGWFEDLVWHDRKLISRFLIKKSNLLLQEASETARKAGETGSVEKT